VRGLRGISPVVATALLVVIAIATAALLYLWVSGIVSSQPTQEPVLYERIKIESVGYDNNESAVEVYVRNVGTVTTELDAIYVIDAVNGTIISLDTNISATLKPGELVNETINNTTLGVGRPYIIKAVTKSGVEASYILVVRE